MRFPRSIANLLRRRQHTHAYQVPEIRQVETVVTLLRNRCFNVWRRSNLLVGADRRIINFDSEITNYLNTEQLCGGQ